MKDQLFKVPEPCISARRLAALWGKSDRFIKGEVKAGELRGYKLKGEIVIALLSTEQYLEARKIVPNKSKD